MEVQSPRVDGRDSWYRNWKPTRARTSEAHRHSVFLGGNDGHRRQDIREGKGPSRGIIQKCTPHERSLCAPKFEERSHEATLHQERCARGVAWNLAENIYKLKNADKAAFHTSVEARAMPAPISTRSEEREFVVDSGASVDMLSKKI